MTVNHVVVDGSNLATEGRTLPSLSSSTTRCARSWASSRRRRSPSSSTRRSRTASTRVSARRSKRRVEAGEIITPPAGVIGRGDAFILQVADRANAVVLSNDSFQEFHGQYTWLFEEGRLIGGKPVPYVGWVFMAALAGARPHEPSAVSDAKKAAKRVEQTSGTDSAERRARRQRSSRHEGAGQGGARRPHEEAGGDRPAAGTQPGQGRRARHRARRGRRSSSPRSWRRWRWAAPVVAAVRCRRTTTPCRSSSSWAPTRSGRSSRARSSASPPTAPTSRSTAPAATSR